MERDAVLAALRAHEPELKASGVVHLAVFGSVARGEAGERSDVDVLVRLADETAHEGFAGFGRRDALSRRLRTILGRPVDVVTEPVRHDALRCAIERDSAVAF